MHHVDPEVACDMAAPGRETHTDQEALQEYQQSSMPVPGQLLPAFLPVWSVQLVLHDNHASQR